MQQWEDKKYSISKGRLGLLTINLTCKVVSKLQWELRGGGLSSVVCKLRSHDFGVGHPKYDNDDYSWLKSRTSDAALSSIHTTADYAAKNGCIFTQKKHSYCLFGQVYHVLRSLWMRPKGECNATYNSNRQRCVIRNFVFCVKCIISSFRIDDTLNDYPLPIVIYC